MLLTKDILRDSPMWQEIEQDGRAQGIAKGTVEGERRALHVILKRRFGVIPAAIEQRIATADRDTLERWIEQSIVADSLEASLT